MTARNWWRTLGLAIVVAVAGCALSPQQITLAPQVKVPSSLTGSGQTIYLQVVDARQNQAFGSRGGVYSQTSLITARNDVIQAVGDAVGNALSQAGYNVDRSGVEGTPTMTVYVDDISYTSPNQNYVSDIRLKSAMRAEIRTQNETYTGTYKTTGEQRVMKAPEEAENARIINELVGRTITRMLEDPRLIDYLR